jgi:glycosyltransferase involved in cell wall biosynthesis
MSSLLAEPRDVLMLVYRFAPVGGSFVQRTVKLVKYLRRLGWRCTIITPRFEGEVLDEDLAREVPADTRVHHAGSSVRAGSPLWQALSRTPGGWRWVPTLRKNLAYPDYAGSWRRKAIEVAERLIAERRFDVLYSASPPASCHVAAMELQQRTGLPWVLDFHDPWTDNIEQYEGIWSVRKRLDRRLERRVLHAGGWIAANTDAQREEFVNHHGVPADRITCIRCGYDEEDFAGEADAEMTKFRICYTGSFYYSYNPQLFFDALAEFLAKRNVPELELTLTGKSCENVDYWLRDRSIIDRIDRRGYVERAKVPALLASSAVLFLTTHPGGRQVPAKFYEYLRAGRPIIATGEVEGDVGRILRRTGRGRFFAPNEREALVDYLDELYAAWRRNGVSLPLQADETVLQYEMRAVAEGFARLFNQAIEAAQ